MLDCRRRSKAEVISEKCQRTKDNSLGQTHISWYVVVWFARCRHFVRLEGKSLCRRTDQPQVRLAAPGTHATMETKPIWEWWNSSKMTVGLACTACPEVELLPLKPKALLKSTSCQVSPTCLHSPLEALIHNTNKVECLPSFDPAKSFEFLPISIVSILSFLVSHENRAYESVF